MFLLGYVGLAVHSSTFVNTFASAKGISKSVSYTNFQEEETWYATMLKFLGCVSYQSAQAANQGRTSSLCWQGITVEGIDHIYV